MKMKLSLTLAVFMSMFSINSFAQKKLFLMAVGVNVLQRVLLQQAMEVGVINLMVAATAKEF